MNTSSPKEHLDLPQNKEDTSNPYEGYSSTIIQLYEQLIEQEAVEADPNEVIALGSIPITSPEGQILTKAGISEVSLNQGQLTRQQLIDAGFAFLNTIGGGEKPLIATTITLADGTLVDTNSRKLLTTDELSALRKQQAGPEADERTRISMIDFIQAAKAMVKLTPEIKKHLFKEAQSLIFDRGNTEDILAIVKLFEALRANNRSYELSFIINSCAAGLPLAKLGSIPVDSYPSRASALQGSPSPFLDSGYHFDTNDDITIYPDDPTKTRRLNSVVIHLLSRGLNEEGASINGSHDQTYITADEFTKLIKTMDTEDAEMDTEDAELYSNETLEAFIIRFVAQAEEFTSRS